MEYLAGKTNLIKNSRKESNEWHIWFESKFILQEQFCPSAIDIDAENVKKSESANHLSVVLSIDGNFVNARELEASPKHF